MAAHRYWRIRLREISGGPNGGLGELQMRTSIGGSNVATGGTPAASSVNTTYTAAKAFDGLTTDTGASNGWLANAFAGSEGVGSYPWLSYDFGVTPREIVEIVVFAPGSGGMNANNLPSLFDWQWSDDNIIWVTQRSVVVDVSAVPWAFSTSRIFDVRPLGPIDIHNGIAHNQIAAQKSYPPGRPDELTYDPESEEGKVRFDMAQYWHDPSFAGFNKLAGSTVSLGDPVPRRVRLYHQHSGRIYAEQYTGADGLFEFINLAIGPWVVVGIDDTGAQNGVIYSHISAVPM